MVDRGGCTFVQKVRNAQRAGAAAMLIADTVCLCGASNCVMGADQTVCETQEPIMADDGSGADISIPSFLVFKQDADRIKDVLMKNQPVRIEMSFSVPAPDSRVEYDLWTTPADAVSRQFLASFETAAVALADDAYFTPHMFIYDGGKAGCHSSVGGENYCEGLCTNAGRYCATDPDGDLDAGVSGTDIIAESLRRICVWNTYGMKDGIGTAWWKYVKEFTNRCDDPDKPGFFTKEDCIADAMKHAGVDKSVIDKCITASGGLEGDTTNNLLDGVLTDKASSGVFLIPSLFVNQAPVRGTLSFSTVFKAICSGYAGGSEPAVCKSCANCHDEQACVTDGACKSGYDGNATPVSGGISAVAFAASMLGITVLFTIVGYIVYQRQQRRMRDEVRGILAEYMPVGSYVHNSLTY
jgi:PA domain